MKADIGDALGQQARVRAISQETSLEIRDIDCLATREDILAALASHTDAPLDESVIKTLRPGYDGTQQIQRARQQSGHVGHCNISWSRSAHHVAS
ncbi:hypothetical protein ACLKA6_005691 [Drosophila palustris]